MAVTRRVPEPDRRVWRRSLGGAAELAAGLLMEVLEARLGATLVAAPLLRLLADGATGDQGSASPRRTVRITLRHERAPSLSS